MATYKSEFLHHHYAGRLRPAAHYSMGWLPLWLRAAGRTPSLANGLMGNRVAAAALKRLGGIAPERALPAVAAESFTRWFARRPPPAGGVSGERVVLFPDTFSNFFDPQVGRAAVVVLEALGYRVEVPSQPLCCGLTWLSTGQLGVARRVLRHTLRTLSPWLDQGVPLVGLEPSCTALLRGDAAQLLDSPATSSLRSLTLTFAEAVDAALVQGRQPAPAGSAPAGSAPLGSAPEAPAEARAVAQVHCHQYAELGYEADRAVLDALGVPTEVLDSGCCGLAGNFGFEKGHYGVSMAAGERVLLPAVRSAPEGTEVLADGFSCRTQIRQASERRPLHLAELAARRWGLALD
jgi:Fe-S oxidoreductase